ncbi:CYTH and CHAD domain-containing protein [Neiella sp. HB171785]|uniref:CYTH and CHAD domain-containing protein n=1 Tax=Neiella litorisoli TaxID=2771431 RepID=A0A8J6UFR2_9GAMM|nr:CYTH and CHAD domain-containing protein [Neiella litorisoli]MBD1389071.1 CYTH and CHAD domain-containing protein [Neiella litorisoli]
MDTEIELKLLVDPNDLETLSNWMQQRPQVIKSYQRQLSNIYFDTADRQLRQLDCGLRVRTVDDRSEQTIKTAGKVIGGLHARPEYNVPIDGRRPDLFLFDRDIWPENTDVAALQESLLSQFTTNFTRQTWLLSYSDDAIVEVVIDHGEISSGERSVPICEMEMELVKGPPSLLFKLAHKVCKKFDVRPGQASKAARGYRLLEGAPEPEPMALPLLNLDAALSIEEAMTELTSAALRQLQSNQDVFFSNDSIAALQEVRHGLLWILQIRHYFNEVLDEASLNLLANAKIWLVKLQWVADALYREQLLEQKDQYMKRLEDKRKVRKTLKECDNSTNLKLASALLSSRDYSQWLLQLSEWLTCQYWRLEGCAQPQLDEPVAQLARNVLDHSKQYVAERFPANRALSADECAKGCERLERALLSGNCFRKMFDPEATSAYRGPWHDMLRGCQELALLAFLQRVVNGIELKDEEAFERWLQRKRESWLELVEQSKHAALAMEPYWR